MRFLLTIMFLLLIPGTVFAQQGKMKPYEMRLKTKSGGIVNAKIMARDQGEAQLKLNKRYPGHTVLNFKGTPVNQKKVTNGRNHRRNSS